MTSATYSLVSAVSSSATFKALPIGTIRMPSANGSNVPVWPTFLVLNFLDMIFTISLLV